MTRRGGIGAVTAPGAVPWQRARSEAFALFDAARLARGFRLAALVLGDESEAEDATQEAIARAWDRWSTLRDRDRFDAWFDHILVNVCRNRLRQRRRVRLVVLEDAGDLAGRESDDDWVTRRALDDAFERLGFDQRAVVVLRYWQDLPIDEIAARLGVPAGTVKSRLHYALRALRSALESTEGFR